MADWMSQYPVVNAAFFIVISGVLAFLVSKALVSAVPWINRVSSRLSSNPEPVLSEAFSRVLQFVAFGAIFLSGIILGLALLGDVKVTAWLEPSWGVVMRLLVALGILVSGHILGALTRMLIHGLSRGDKLAAFPQIAYVVIAGVALLMALGHLGLDTSFITQVILVFVAVFFTGLALAFAFGAKTLVANLSAAGELVNYKPGDRLRIDGIEGTVIETHRTGAVLSTDEGLVRLPAKMFAEMTVTVLRKEEADG